MSRRLTPAEQEAAWDADARQDAEEAAARRQHQLAIVILAAHLADREAWGDAAEWRDVTWVGGQPVRTRWVEPWEDTRGPNPATGEVERGGGHVDVLAPAGDTSVPTWHAFRVRMATGEVEILSRDDTGEPVHLGPDANLPLDGEPEFTRWVPITSTTGTTR